MSGSSMIEMGSSSRSSYEEQISTNIEESKVGAQDFPSLEEVYGANGAFLTTPRNGVDSKMGLVGADCGRNINNPEVILPDVADSNSALENPSSSQIGGIMGKGLNPNPNSKDWRALFYVPRPITKQASMKFTSPVEVNGEMVVAAQSEKFSKEMKRCENRVVGFFVGKRLSFSAVQVAVGKLWKFRKEVDLHHKTSFSLRPWSLLLEKSVSDINSVPIWVLIYGIPLHMWDNEGLGMISSFLGKPLLADNCTINQDRLAYARICVEIDTNFSYPDKIPLLIDEKYAMNLPVEYPWRPPRYEACLAFGHSSKNCIRKTRKRWIPKKGIIPSLETAERIDGGSAQDKNVDRDVNINSSRGVETRKDRDSEVDTIPMDAAIENVVSAEVATSTVMKNRAISPGKLKGRESVVNTQPASVNHSVGAVAMGDRDAVAVEREMRTDKGNKPQDPVEGNSELRHKGSGLQEGSSKSVNAVILDPNRAKSSTEIEGDWTVVKGKKQTTEAEKFSPSPKKNPFMVFSDFKAESRFPINRKKEDEDFEHKFKYLSEEERMVKKQERGK